MGEKVSRHSKVVLMKLVRIVVVVVRRVGVDDRIRELNRGDGVPGMWRIRSGIGGAAVTIVL